MGYVPCLNGKIIAGCEILSFNEDTMVGLANFRGMLVRFEGKRIDQPFSAEYASLSLRPAGDNLIELVEKEG